MGTETLDRVIVAAQHSLQVFAISDLDEETLARGQLRPWSFTVDTCIGRQTVYVGSNPLTNVPQRIGTHMAWYWSYLSYCSHIGLSWFRKGFGPQPLDHRHKRWILDQVYSCWSGMDDSCSFCWCSRRTQGREWDTGIAAWPRPGRFRLVGN